MNRSIVCHSICSWQQALWTSPGAIWRWWRGRSTVCFLNYVWHVLGMHLCNTCLLKLLSRILLIFVWVVYWKAWCRRRQTDGCVKCIWRSFVCVHIRHISLDFRLTILSKLNMVWDMNMTLGILLLNELHYIQWPWYSTVEWVALYSMTLVFYCWMQLHYIQWPWYSTVEWVALQCGFAMTLVFYCWMSCTYIQWPWYSTVEWVALYSMTLSIVFYCWMSCTIFNDLGISTVEWVALYSIWTLVKDLTVCYSELYLAMTLACDSTVTHARCNH